MSSRTPLELLEIPSPCPASWNQMTGDRQSRFCQHCHKHVHNLSAMPREQAERLVCQSAGDLCVRLTRRWDGNVVTLNYHSPMADPHWSRKAKALAAFALALVSSLVGAALFGNGRDGLMTTVAGNMPAYVPPTPMAPGVRSRPGNPGGPQPNADFDI